MKNKKLDDFMIASLHDGTNKLPLLFLQVQQTMHRGQRQAKSVQILQAEEVLQSRHEERRWGHLF